MVGGLTSAVNAACLDRDQQTAALLQEQPGVQANDSGLIRLGDIGENNIDHRTVNG